MSSGAGRIDHQAMVALLQELIRRPSRNPPGEERACAELLTERLDGWGFETELIAEPFPERPQVVARLRGSAGRPVLILNGHLDTVPEVDAGRLSVDPFGGVVKDGKVWGRGGCD